MTVLPPINDPTVHAEIDRLARRYVDAGGLGMDLLNSVGTTAENLIGKLPASVNSQLDSIIRKALNHAFDVASGSRRLLRDRGDWFNRLLSTASGAVGGIAGLPGVAVELPFTITFFLRGMVEIAIEHGFDPNSEEVRLGCLRIFAAGGPMAEDDGADLGLLAARMSITGQTVHGLIGKVAPKLVTALSPKVAAQATPIFGAVAGASINNIFAGYYQQLARVHFGLMRLSRETGLPDEALIEALRLSIERIDKRKRLPRV